MGRYILGLLGGLRSIAAIRPAGEPHDRSRESSGDRFEVRPLFAPAASLLPEEAEWAGLPAGERGAKELQAADAAGRLRIARSAAKRLPFAYAARELLRSVSLSRQAGLDVFHETNHAAPRTRLPLVLTIHDLCTVLYPETQEPARARFFARALRHRARLALQVITPTAAIARQVIDLLGVEAARVRTIHHGVDPALLEALALPFERPAVLEAAGVGGGYLLFVGALEPRKGLPVLLDAYDRLPPAVTRAFPLLLVGPAERIDGPLRRRLDAARAGRVVALGYTPPGMVAALYRGATALCLPSSYEGFGLPLLEALASGTPCATTDDPALVEVAAGCALHAPRGDASALAGLLERLCEDGALRARLAAAGRARAAGLTWEASARAHLAAYRAAAAEGHER